MSLNQWSSSEADQANTDSDSDPVIIATPRELRKMRGGSFTRSTNIAQYSDSIDVTDSDSDPVITATPRELRKAGRLPSIVVTDTDSDPAVGTSFGELRRTKSGRITKNINVAQRLTTNPAACATAIEQAFDQSLAATEKVKPAPRSAAKKAKVAITLAVAADVAALAETKAQLALKHT